MFKRLKVCLGLLLVFIFYSCDIGNLLDPKLPKWSIDLDIPLLEKTILIRENILDIDSSITIYPDLNTENEFDSLFVYRLNEQIDSTFIDDKLNIQDVIDTTITQSVDDITVENISFIEIINFSDVGIGSVVSGLTTEIGLITLDNINPQDSEPYTFENLLPVFHETITTFLASPGNSGLGNSPYDEAQLGPIYNETITPTSKIIEFTSFEFANFDSGIMNIDIDNTSMYLDFENILIELEDANTNSTLYIIDVGVMASGQAYNEEVNLGNLPDDGYLPNNLNIIISGIVSGISDGASYNQLLNSQIGISVSAENLVVSEASAKLPEQNFNDNGSFVLDNENKILEATINTGFLMIELENNLPEDLVGNISINIPNIMNPTEEELLFSFNLSEPVNPINLNQYKIVIDDIDEQQIFYNYSVTTLSTEDYVVINQSDNIDINFKLVGDISDEKPQITFSAINGIIEAQDPDEISDDVDLEVKGAIIENATFQSGEILIEIINNISNAPLVIDIVIDDIKFKGEPFTREIRFSEGAHNVTFSLENHILTPGNYDTEEQTVFFSAKANSSDDSDELEYYYNLEEDITVNLLIQNIVIKEVEGFFTQEPIIETNLVDLESENIIKEGSLSSGNIEITINNNLGLHADVNFRIDQILDNDDETLSITIPLNDSPQEVVNIDLSNYSIVLIDDINSDSYQKISYTSEVVINSEVLTTLNLENNIEITFKIPELTFSSLQGYIAPVEVEIAPFSKTDLNILPDDVEGITFNNASAYLDFDSELDLDLLLQLDFYSSNTDSGEEYSFQFIEQTSTSIDRIYLNSDDILNMINLVPDSISVSGLATVSGDGIINSTDAIAAEFIIEVPFEFIFNDDTRINIPSSELSEDSIPNIFESMTLYYQYKTSFNFNTYLSIYCSDDTTTIINDSNKFIDFALLPSDEVLTDSIEVSSDKFDLLSSSDFMKPIVNIISLTDENGDFTPQSFYSTDSLNIKLWSKIGLTIDGNE